MPHAAQPSAALLLDPARFRGELDGQAVKLFTLRNRRGMVACIANYGAKIVQLLVPDRHGDLDDVVLGYDNLDGYLKETPYFGALIGRYGNRIAKGKFTLNGQQYTLATNNGPIPPVPWGPT